MEGEKGWNFKMGNSPELPLFRKNENPIPKELIDSSILDYFYSKVDSEQKNLLEISDFDVNFLCMGDEVAFVEFNITSGNGNKIDLKLAGEDAKKFVELIVKTQFDIEFGNN